MINYLNLDDEKKLANSLYYSGGYTKFEHGGEHLTPEELAEKKENTAQQLGAGLAVGSAAIDALDTNPDYNNVDVAGSAMQFASMGAAAGPIGAAVGGAVGLGIGLLKKNKFQKEEKQAAQKKEQEESYNLDISDNADFAQGFSTGGVINKYNHGGETHPPFINLYTQNEIADAIDPMSAYMAKNKKNISPEKLAQIRDTGTITEDKGMWNEDKGMIWNARNLLNEAVTNVQNASLRPGGSGGKKNMVTTAASEMFALPSINRLTRPGGDIDHLLHDPGKASNYMHAGLNVIGSLPGASLVSKSLRTSTGKILPKIKGFATETMDKLSDVAKNYMGETGLMTAELIAPQVVKGEKVLHQGHRAFEIQHAANSKKYAVGGMTQGAYSHQSNPLAVVDKQGNHTGMELTGGEGVFDKPAMDKIKKLLQGGRFDEVGSFVNNEMKTWKHK